MLFIFLVDTGVMYTFDVELAMGSVQMLMSTVASVTGVPEEKQVLLISGGETLDPTERVCDYNSAGTDTSPIFLFSKSTIEASIPPSPSLNLGSEASLREQAQESFDLPPTYETLVTRAQLASEFDRLAADISESCESLVGEQRLQQHGWNAVVSNLENISREFQVRASTVQQIFTDFLEMRADYMGLLNSFDQVMPVLMKVPVFPTLLTRQQSLVSRAGQNTVSLLEWINAQDIKNSLQDMVNQCIDAVKQFDDNVLQEIATEINQVQESLDNSSMKEIKGLDERLGGLQQLMEMVQTLRQSQADMAQGFLQNQTRAQNLGDPSVLPDLCASHQKQLMVLLKNHSQLKDIRRRCARAKDELSANLHTRLRWIMYVEKKICDCDSTLILYHENIRRLRRRLDIIEQVNEAPKMYVLAAREVVRRRTFSGQFFKWASKVYESSAQTQTEELLRREEFTVQFGRHFLHNLFTGLDDQPSSFGDKPPKTFDEQLPLITEHDLRDLLELIPELSDHIESVPVSVSMKDESKAASFPLDDKTLGNQEKVPCFEMTGSINKASAMSIDASTQAQWPERSAREESSTAVEERETEGEMAVELCVPMEDTTDKASEKAKEEPAVDSQKTNGNSDTGSERSSGLEDNDLFKSAHEDYVTVVGADLKVDLEDPIPLERSDDKDSLSLGESSQTATLTSSVSQVIDHSTQTDDLEDVSTAIHESIPDAIGQITHSQDELAKMELALESSTARRDKYRESHRLLKDLLCKELPMLKDAHSESKELVENRLVEIKNYVVNSLREVKSREEERARHLHVTMAIMQQERDELEMKRQMVSELEGERNQCEEKRTELEHEKKSLLGDVKRLQIEKTEIEIQLKRETERLKEIIQDYRSKFEAQQSTTQKLQEHKSLSEEGQQIRYNSIITKMKREKEQAVGQALEKVKEIELQVHRQRELTSLAVEEKETLVQVKEAERSKFSQREQELLESFDAMEAKLHEAEKVLLENEQSFQQRLEEERAKTLQLLQVERQVWEAQEARQSDQKTVETERGTEAIVEEEYVQRMQLLEKENKALRERISSQSGVEGSSMDQTKQALQAKDIQINALQQQLIKSLQSPGGAAASQHEKISLKDFQSGSLMLLVFDEVYENYLVLSTAPTLHFLHPESLTALDIATSGPKRRAWMLAQLIDKEYCQAKKAHNRFHVPVGTKFYRIHAKPYISSDAAR